MHFPSSLRRTSALLLLSLVAFVIQAAGAPARPEGRILYQPQLLWADSMTTLQGTGYIIEHQGKYFGVTSIHFMNFDAGGLRSATWLDVFSEQPLATFRSSLGRPVRTAITQLRHVADDFVLLPLSRAPEGGGPFLHLEAVDRYEPGTPLWFPNKNRSVEVGHVWLDAAIAEDAGTHLVVRIREPVTLESQSGSPVLNANTGKVVGMIYSGEVENGQTLLTLCPARSLVKHLGRRQQITSLANSIRRR